MKMVGIRQQKPDIELTHNMYKDLIKNKKIPSLDIPNTIVPLPTTTDYENQFIIRYFIQKVNDDNGFVFEVDEQTYFEYKTNPYWKSEEIKWRIAGPIDEIYDDMGMLLDKGVKKSNEGILNFAAANIKNIRLYFPNLLQFYKQFCKIKYFSYIEFV